MPLFLRTSFQPSITQFTRLAPLAAVLLATSLTSGCASIVSKSDYPVLLTSNPDNAKVVVRDHTGNLVFSGVTPAQAVLSSKGGFMRAANYQVEFSKPGHQTAYTYATARFDSWYLGNILFGGLIGLLIVDPATGAMWRMEPNVTASLYPAPQDTTPALSDPDQPADVVPPQMDVQQSADDALQQTSKAPAQPARRSLFVR